MGVESGYAAVDGTEVYWESRGSGGPPLLLVHGGYGMASGFEALADLWARDRQVIAVELDGHGHTRRSGRPFRWETFGDDLAGVIQGLGFDAVDLLGYSLGGGASLRCAIQHPSLVRRLVLVSAPHRRDAWYPEVRAGFDGMSAAALFEQFRHSPMYAAWEKVAPDPSGFPALIDATGDLLRQPYDWSAEVAGLPMRVLLAYADADSIPPVGRGRILRPARRRPGRRGLGRLNAKPFVADHPARDALRHPERPRPAGDRGAVHRLTAARPGIDGPG